MPPLCQEVRDLIRASEVIQAILAQGGCLTSDEREILRSCAIELLVALRRNGRGVRAANADKR